MKVTSSPHMLLSVKWLDSPEIQAEASSELVEALLTFATLEPD
jgi:hypothetical protein